MKPTASLGIIILGSLLAPGRARPNQAPRIVFRATSQLLIGQKDAVAYDVDGKHAIEIPIPQPLGSDGWICVLSARKAEGNGYSQGIYCLNKSVHSMIEVAAKCGSEATSPVVATSTLRSDRSPGVGVEFMVGCMATAAMPKDPFE